jgi:molybdopterin-guanine dinucleotide biosynthesis protein A
MGAEKLTLQLAGRSILDRILERMIQQTEAVVINSNADHGRFAATGLTLVPDAVVTGTPLSGLHAALGHACRFGFDAVLSVPSDAPFIPLNLAEGLSSAKTSAAVAGSGTRTHFLTGLWAVSQFELLNSVIGGAPMRALDWVSLCHAAVVTWQDCPFDPFFNINTPTDLAEAERIAAQYGL